MKPSLVEKKSEISGVNVAPIIDVALVLVIILLITAPMFSIPDLNLLLPRALSRGAETEHSIDISYTRTGELAVDDEFVSPENLVAALRSRLAELGDPNALVVIRADAQVPHRIIRQGFKAASAAGVRQLAIATVQAGTRR